MAAWQRALHHVWVQKLQVSHGESIACVTCSTKSSPSRWPLYHFAGRTWCRTCPTAPLTGPSVKSCSIRSTSTVSGTTWGLKSFSGDKHAQPSEPVEWHIIHLHSGDAQILTLLEVDCVSAMMICMEKELCCFFLHCFFFCQKKS